MEPSSSSASFTSLNNSTLSSDFPPPQSSYSQQHHGFPPPYFPPNIPPPPPYATNQQPHYAHNFNPYGAPSGYQQFRPGSSNYPFFPYQGGVGQYQQGPSGVGMASDPSSPIESTFFFGSAGGSGSRGDESGSPLSFPQPVQGGPIIEEECDSSPEEGKKNSRRKYWSEEENIRLVSAWLNNSNDPVKGNDKKFDHYWKEVTNEYNKYSPRDHRRLVPQCKSHWNKNAPKVTKFNSCWHRMKSAHGSGESDEQILERAHAVYKNENKEKPFLFEYWWRVVKDQPKWARVYPLQNKRLKLNASGAYTSSSNQDTDEASAAAANPRPPGRNMSRAKLKGKGKSTAQCLTDRLSNETVQVFNDSQLKKTEAIEKMASATTEHAKAIADQNNIDKMSKYIQLMTIDTRNFCPAEKARHDMVLNYFTKELFPGDES
ncbi:unnamed protein product [Urochloa humidicola]